MDLLGHIGFFVAGFFLPSLPWAPLVALVVQALALLATPQYRIALGDWWYRSRTQFARLLVWQLATAAAANTLLMLVANFIGDVPIRFEPAPVPALIQ